MLHSEDEERHEYDESSKQALENIALPVRCEFFIHNQQPAFSLMSHAEAPNGRIGV